MSEPWRAVIVGCGKIAGGYNAGPDDPMVLTHALAYLRHPGFKLAACVDVDARARSEFKAKWDIPQDFATLGQALAVEQFDIVSICTPTGTHLTNLEQLHEAKLKAIFAEKPLDCDAVKARRMGDQFKAKGVPVAVNFMRRFDRTMHDLRDAVRSGRHGALRSVVGWYSGGLVNNGSHLIDLIIFLTGRTPTIVHVDRARSDSTGDQPVSCVLELAGVPFHIIGSSDADVTRFEIELAFERSIMSIEDGGMTMRTRRAGPSPAFPSEVVFERGSWSETNYGSAMVSALDELLAWRTGGRLSSDIASACEAIELVTNISLHSRKGQG